MCVWGTGDPYNDVPMSLPWRGTYCALRLSFGFPLKPAGRSSYSTVRTSPLDKGVAIRLYISCLSYPLFLVPVLISTWTWTDLGQPGALAINRS